MIVRKTRYSTMLLPCVNWSFIPRHSLSFKSENIKKPLVCTCCDYSTDEDMCSEEDGIPCDKIKKIDDKTLKNSEKDQNKKIQAGWFGKGYKKGKRLKRR
ncbi:hypothetical protein QE152_g31187 [Popillia japonica]|uniref:Uncharacterized protein n=1 Tax=Popillia japonica TaxID=7064 RepID=A0AAW1JC37_POPJA